MNSMTGYGAGTAMLGPPSAGGAAREVFAEAASVNRKGLEIAVSLPRDWLALEAAVTELARTRLHRGQVRLTITVRDPAAERTPGASGPQWDEAAVSATLGELRRMAEKLQVPFAPDADLLWRVAQGTGHETALPAADDARPAVEAAVTAALTQLSAARRREGDALHNDLAARVAILNKLRDEVAPLTTDCVTRYREGLHTRLKQIGLPVDLNDERVLREIALFADRCDIAEEVTRLASHFEQFGRTLAEDGAVGRKLDFLCQEIHREFNTIGSKAQHLEITRRVLEAKNELERAREQVQNVE